MAIREFLTKQLSQMLFGRTTFRFPFPGYAPRSKINYARELGDGTSSDIVMSNVHWLMTTVNEPPVMLYRRNAERAYQPVDTHPVLDLLESPNPHYDAGILLSATELSYIVDGNAYWVIIRSAAGRPVELWWAPHWMIEPRWALDGSDYISYYQYRTGAEPIRLDPEDVVHFRFGLDPDNQRKGLSRLKAVMRELFTDAEAANWTAALLRNGGVPGVVISPDPQSEGPVSPDDLKATQDYVNDRYTGDNRGSPLVIGGATKVQMFGYNPQQMNLKDMRRLPEERGCAAIGMPPIISGFGAGLDRATYANYQEAERVVYRANLSPTWRSWGMTIRRQLLNQFEPDIGPYMVGFDTSEISALQEDKTVFVTRMLSELNGGGITLAEYREATGWPVEDNFKVFIRPLNVVEIPVDMVGKLPDPDELQPGAEEPAGEAEGQGEGEGEGEGTGEGEG